MKKLLPVLFALGMTLTGYSQEGTMLISELLYQPRSGEAEYVELYNNTTAAIELSNYHIVRWIGDSLGSHYPLPQHTVPAHDYVVLTKDAASVVANYNVRFMSNLVECNLPPYPNGGGSVILATADSTAVDRFDYSNDMQSRLLRNKAGVALERRSFARPTGEAANWFSAASTAGYGTPGYENSQSTEWLAEETAFEFSSTLLSPDGDGYQDELEIDYRLDDGKLTAKAEVYDARGTVVRRLLNNALLGTHGSLRWDCTNDNGKTVMPGQYIVGITVFDIGGTRQTIRRVLAITLPH